MKESIPKTVHYCWFGRGKLPELSAKCIDSWKKYLPDYEIKKWDEDNFDVNIIPYTAEAYKAKKYAFVSDYARFWTLHNYGGIYFDTDVEVIKPMTDIIEAGAFMGCQADPDNITPGYGIACAPGLGIACAPGLSIYKELLDFYQARHFNNKDGSIDMTTVVEIATRILKGHGLQEIPGIQKVAGLNIYPREYFSPISCSTGKYDALTDNTYSIHHFSGSWMPFSMRLKKSIFKYINGNCILAFLKRKLRYILRNSRILRDFTKY